MPRTITCADCGSTQTIPLLPPRGMAQCHRCARLLDRRTYGGIELPLACSVAMAILIFPASLLPLMHSTIRNLVFDQTRLVSSVRAIYAEVWFPFAFGFLFFAFLFPAIRAFLLVIVLSSIRFKFRFPQRGRLFRFAEELRIWSMTDVVLIAGAVAYMRANIPADVEVLVGTWFYLAVAIVSFIIDQTLDRRTVWGAILPDCETRPGRNAVSCGSCELIAPNRVSGEPCPRCGDRLDRDPIIRFAPALGAVAAAMPLAIPAYSFSVMVNDQLTAVLEHTIFGTVQLLADRGYWEYGLIIIIAGVIIPAVEIVGMTWLLLRVRFPSKEGLVVRTRIYRLLHRLVRWPMIIPFIAAIAAPIVDFRGIDDIVAGPGATPLFLLIASLMLAVRLFEPQLMWKTAGEAQ